MTQPHRTAALLLLAALAGGCSTPPHDMAASAPARSFSVPLPSDQAYRHIVQGARTCYARFAVDADYFPDNRSGRVALVVKTDLNVTSLFVADLASAGDGTTVRVAYLKGNPAFADAVQQWTKGDYTHCPFS